jgi:YIF1
MHPQQPGAGAVGGPMGGFGGGGGGGGLNPLHMAQAAGLDARAVGDIAGAFSHAAELGERAEGRVGMLKYYFNVSNSYVLAKLKLILFPLRHENWVRELAQDGESYRCALLFCIFFGARSHAPPFFSAAQQTSARGY